MATTTHPSSSSEVEVLARVLGSYAGERSGDLARHILGSNFSDPDRRRMHELAARDQEDALSPAEREELFAFVKAGDLLSILKAKARRALGVKPGSRTIS